MTVIEACQCSSLYSHRPHVPDFLTVFRNGAVGREFAAARGVEDGHPCPALYVLPGRINLFLTGDVGSVIGQHEERIIMDQIIDQRAKYLRITPREVSRTDKLQNGT